MLKAVIAATALFIFLGGMEADENRFDFFFSVVAASGPFWMSVVLHSGSDEPFADWDQPALEFLIALISIFILGGVIGYGVTIGSVYFLGKTDIMVGSLVTKGWVIALYLAFLANAGVALALVWAKKKWFS